MLSKFSSLPARRLPTLNSNERIIRNAGYRIVTSICGHRHIVRRGPPARVRSSSTGTLCETGNLPVRKPGHAPPTRMEQDRSGIGHREIGIADRTPLPAVRPARRACPCGGALGRGGRIVRSNRYADVAMIRTRNILLILAGLVLMVTVAGLLTPERLAIPVDGADQNDWNHQTFWHAPWGASGVHHGIDIFAASGTPVLAATPGIVVFRGELGRGGNVVLVLGPKWRFHYYAHLSDFDVQEGQWVGGAEPLGRVGTSGNAAGRPAHLHYSVVTPIPYPWRFRTGPYGWRRMFFLNPHAMLMAR